MTVEERVYKLEQEQEQEKNVASLSFLQGYIKGLEERINRLEKTTN